MSAHSGTGIGEGEFEWGFDDRDDLNQMIKICEGLRSQLAAKDAEIKEYRDMLHGIRFYRIKCGFYNSQPDEIEILLAKYIKP